MRLARLFLALVLVFTGTLQAADWQMEKRVRLKKDAFSHIAVKSEGFEKLLKLRWTLYKNNGLVVIRHYDGFVGHHVLYLRNKNNSFRIDLLPPGEGYGAQPFLLVKFSAFDAEKGEAVFDLFLRDQNDETLLQILKENR